MRKLILVVVLMHHVLLQLYAQMPVDGGVYKIINSGRNSAVLTEDFGAHNVYCTSDGDNIEFVQFWKFTRNGNGWNIKNVYTGRYVKGQTSLYTPYTTTSEIQTLYVLENATITQHYNIMNQSNGGYGLHCDVSYLVVPWTIGSGAAGGTEWTFERVDISEESQQQAHQQYLDYLSVLNNQSSIKNSYTSLFEDELCTTLKEQYAVMSDDDLKQTIGDCPEELKTIALKIKNDHWANREKEFRIHHYEAYSNPEHWATSLNTFCYSWLNNPTGIYANAGNVIYLFVGNDIPHESTLQVDMITDNSPTGNRVNLVKGMNIIPITRNQSMLFVLYTADTRGTARIGDFATIPIHIQGGVLNGYWDKKRHNDSDWVDISQNMGTHDFIQVKGDRVLFHMHRSAITDPTCCKQTITDAIGWWDSMAVWQHQLMGLDDIQPSRFNNKLCARSTDTGYQSASNYQTNYARNYIKNLLPLNNVLRNADNAWGPGHENGHVHQGAINMIACTEVSNNLFSNRTLEGLGKYMSRGSTITNISEAFQNNLPWPSRSGSLTLRMYWQLYLYYHQAGNNPQFYPRLFKLLRESPMSKTGGDAINQGSKDLLHFAEKCSEASGEDMTAFFESWGFFVPMNRMLFDDYGNFYLTSTQAMIDATKLKMAAYSKKAGAIEFIEDRVRPILRTDGGTGNKLTTDIALGAAGDVGHFTDFTPDKMNTNAIDYVFTRTGRVVNFVGGHDAVGFKIYNTDHSLLMFTNRFEITLPTNIALMDLIYKAVSANGSECIIESIEEGSIEVQKLALEKTLLSANVFLNLSDATNTKVGYYHAHLLQELNDLVMEAQLELDNNTPITHSFGQWCNLINSEIDLLLLNDDLKVELQAENSYKLVNVMYPNHTMILDSKNLKCSSSVQTGESAKFKIVPHSKKGQYYLSTKTHQYVNQLGLSSLAIVDTEEIEQAIIFDVVDNGNATFHFTQIGDNNLSLHCDAAKNVVGWYSNATASHWKIEAVECVKEEADKVILQSVISEAVNLIDKLVDVNLTTPDMLVYKSNILVTDANLDIFVRMLMDEIGKSQLAIDNNQSGMYKEKNELLTSLMQYIDNGYSYVTGIESISNEIESSNTIFDINGKRVTRMTESGIYIVNGKKRYIE